MFWSDSLNPNSFVGTASSIPEERVAKVVEFLSGGELSELHKGGIFYKGFAKCRVCGKPLGSMDLVRNGFIFPQGCEHYITEHGVWYDALDEIK
jgi:hypothetical protein